MTKHENANSVGRDPEGAFYDLAIETGLVINGAQIDGRLIAFAYGAAELCACVGDLYDGPGESNAGKDIRAQLGRLTEEPESARV